MTRDAPTERLAAALTDAPWALKEWTTVCEGLLGGRHALLVRKGGIHEPGFAMRASSAWLFPTGFHGPDGSGEASRDTGVVIPGAITIVARWSLATAGALEAVADYSPMDMHSMQTRFALRPQHRLWALLVRAHPLARPTPVPWHRSYGGCRSWVTLRAPPAEALGPAVRPELAQDLAALTALLGPPQLTGQTVGL